eukprot:NODE_1315_length_2013_cov_52.512169_g1111_i0.p1 GENE.NODE_1315_length_2013_cov_52.512169_g1111_i0~~NODE_1315_length_2013_cov_52.512169_g1111_i0.p1  ORF type:complete len:670 (+),score=102.58 NODE_1315_length_2013_cov_52.512169_g1111_i0:46-2010(+)
MYAHPGVGNHSFPQTSSIRHDFGRGRPSGPSRNVPYGNSPSHGRGNPSSSVRKDGIGPNNPYDLTPRPVLSNVPYQIPGRTNNSPNSMRRDDMGQNTSFPASETYPPQFIPNTYTSDSTQYNYPIPVQQVIPSTQQLTQQPRPRATTSPYRSTSPITPENIQTHGSTYPPATPNTQIHNYPQPAIAPNLSSFPQYPAPSSPPTLDPETLAPTVVAYPNARRKPLPKESNNLHGSKPTSYLSPQPALPPEDDLNNGESLNDQTESSNGLSDTVVSSVQSEETRTAKEKEVFIENGPIPNSLTFSPMFGVIVQGAQPIVKYVFEEDHLCYALPDESFVVTQPSFLVCVYLMDNYRLLPYSFVDVHYSSAPGEEWQRMGQMDSKRCSLFLQFPRMMKNHKARLGIQIIGQLPREIVQSSILPQHYNIDEGMILIMQGSSLDVLEVRRHLLRVNNQPNSTEDYFMLAEQRLGWLEKISQRCEGASYICLLNGIIEFIRDNLLTYVPENDERTSQCLQRINKLRMIRPSYREELIQGVKKTFMSQLQQACGLLMSKADVVSPDPKLRLESGQKIITQFESAVEPEVRQIEALYDNEVVGSCLKFANEKAEQFFGWIEARFVDNSPSELRAESKRLTTQVNFIIQGFSQGTPWYHLKRPD